MPTEKEDDYNVTPGMYVCRLCQPAGVAEVGVRHLFRLVIPLL